MSSKSNSDSRSNRDFRSLTESDAPHSHATNSDGSPDPATPLPGRSGFGWDRALAAAFETYSARKGTDPGARGAGGRAAPCYLPARVTAVHRTLVETACEGHPVTAIALGRVPPLAVGDWVVLELTSGPEAADGAAVVVDLLPRKGVLSRNAAGRAARSQVLASHVDTVAVVTACGGDFNLARVERFLVAARSATPRVAVILTKSDLLPPGEVEALLERIRERTRSVCAPGDVVATSALSGEGLGALAVLFPPARTVVLLGTSGVGKSTLTNSLLGEDRILTQSVGDVKDRGRHTTTHRELHVCAGGALLVDSPGIRELQLEDVEEGLAEVFEDLAALEAACRYADCRHESEPGCAVRAALDDGSLPQERWRSYEKMRREAEYQRRRGDAKAEAEERKKWKGAHLEARARQKVFGKRR